MAADATLQLKVLLKAAGIEPTAKQLKKLSQELQGTAKGFANVSKEANTTYRNQRGVAQATGRANKDFSRMQQGMGGLVQAYATVAANVFALSSAFLVLRRAADLSSMVKSAEDFSNRFGVSVTRITKQMQEASGGALSFAEALPSINKAVSAGVGIEQMEKLTVAATKASQTFGGTTTEALNRFISASQRGRVEIIQTLGVVIKTEQAYKDYAARIGKTALELTAFDRQQAILAATIAESEKVFAGVKIDPNPFTQLATTMTDVKDTMITFITDALTPMINMFNQSTNAALALMAVIGGSVLKRLLPAISGQVAQAHQASTASTMKALQAARRAKQAATKVMQEENQKIIIGDEKSYKRSDDAFTKSLGKKVKASKIFGESIIDENNKVNTQLLRSKRAQIAKEIKLRESGETKGRQKALEKATTAELKAQQRAYDQIAASQGKVAISAERRKASEKAITSELKIQKAQNRARWAEYRAQITRTGSLYKTGFAQTFALSQENMSKAMDKTKAAWKDFGYQLTRTEKSLNKNTSALGSFGRAMGRTGGLISGVFSRALSSLTSLLLVISLAKLAWELFGDTIQGISKDLRKTLETLKEVGETFKENTERVKTYIGEYKEGSRSFAKFIADMEFLRGTLDTINHTISKFEGALNLSVGIKSVNLLAKRFESMDFMLRLVNKQIETLEAANTRVYNTAYAGPLGSIEVITEFVDLTKEQRIEMEQLKAKQEQLNIKGKTWVNILETVSTGIGPELVSQFNTLVGLFSTQGLTGLSEELRSQLKAGFEAIVPEQGEALAAAFTMGPAAFQKILEGSVDDLETQGLVYIEIMKALKEITPETLNAAGNFVASGKAIQDINSQLGTYFSGLDKLKAASIPNKEQFNFLMGLERNLKILRDTAETVGAEKRLGEAVKAEDLDNLQKFLGFTEKMGLQDAIDLTEEILEKYKNVMMDALLASKEQKVLQIQLNTLKSEEVNSFAESVENLREEERLRGLILDKQILVAQRAIDAQNETIKGINRFKEGGEKALAIAEAELVVLEHQRDAYIAQRKVVSASTKDQQLILDNELKRLDALKQANNLITRTFNIYKKISKSIREELRLANKLSALEKEKLRLAKADLLVKIERAKAEQLEGDALLAKLIPLEAELLLLQAQTAEYEKQQKSIEARNLETEEGVSIFSKKGITEATNFFVDKLRDMSRDLKSTFQIIGEGFAKNINDTFDAAVDNLLEGGRDFGHNMLETIKAGLRETFGEALKTRIREAFANIFNRDDGKPAADPMLTKLQELIDALKDNTNALTGGVVGGMSPISEEFGPPNVLNLFKKDEKDPEDPKKELKDIETASTGTTNAVKEGFEMSTKSIVSTFSVLATALFGQKVADSGGSLISSIFSVFGAANGAIMKGGITPLAAGGMVKQPTLAMVGEGNRNEAVVPLPNNREIPVEIREPTGDTINIEQNFDFTNADAGSISLLRNEARAIEERTFNRVFTEINKGGKYAKVVGRRK